MGRWPRLSTVIHTIFVSVGVAHGWRGASSAGLLAVAVAVAVAITVVTIVGAELVIASVTVRNGGRLGVVAGPNLLRGGVFRKLVVEVDRLLLFVAAEEGEKTTTLAARPRGIVVSGAGAETLLLLAMAGEKDLSEYGKDKEEARFHVSMLVPVINVKSSSAEDKAYMATMETAKQAVCRRHAW